MRPSIVSGARSGNSGGSPHRRPADATGRQADSRPRRFPPVRPSCRAHAIARKAAGSQRRPQSIRDRREDRYPGSPAHRPRSRRRRPNRSVVYRLAIRRRRVPAQRKTHGQAVRKRSSRAMAARLHSFAGGKFSKSKRPAASNSRSAVRRANARKPGFRLGRSVAADFADQPGPPRPPPFRPAPLLPRRHLPHDRAATPSHPDGAGPSRRPPR
jgi:hypothetical protein